MQHTAPLALVLLRPVCGRHRDRQLGHDRRSGWCIGGAWLTTSDQKAVFQIECPSCKGHRFMVEFERPTDATGHATPCIYCQGKGTVAAEVPDVAGERA